MDLQTTAKALRESFGEGKRAQRFMSELLEGAGLVIDGPAPHDPQIRDDRFYAAALRDGSLGLGESYMEGWWDSEALDETLVHVISAGLNEKVKGNWKFLSHVLLARLTNMQSLTRAFEVGEQHYDLGNELYKRMLDPRMAYTCGYWRNAKDLATAQEHKLDLVCRKIGAHKGMKILELGCGWGSFAKFAAEHYGAHVTGYTVSKEQAALGMERAQGLPVDLRFADYRGAQGSYDAVISIGIMEHIGGKNYRTYMEVADRCLAPGGVSFVHTIAGNESRNVIDPWMHKYIFPNALLPTISQIGQAMEGIFILEDVHNFGPDYDTTLMAWSANFDEAWPEFREQYGDKFYRMWKYYLMCSAACSRSRYIQLFHIVMSRPGTPQPDCRAS